MWRKNRQPNSGSSCVGTDINRNFDSEWCCELEFQIYSKIDLRSDLLGVIHFQKGHKCQFPLKV